VTEPLAPTGAWRTATVVSIDHPTSHGVRLRLDVADRIDHLPGQHYVIRLTAEDGYVAQRSYSLSSAPSDPMIEFYVERLDDGEVSSFLADVLLVGDELEVRGPIGGWFVWRGETEAVGVAGGSGVVPLVSMVRHAAALGRTDLLHLAVSARTRADLPYADELIAAGALVALTREDQPHRPSGRLTSAELASVHATDPVTHFVCGSPAFAAGIADQLLALQVPSEDIRLESFGPSG
jgi:ferredoxin-NADP reductase